MKTYDVVFNDQDSSNEKGFKTTYEKCLEYIETWNGTDHSYFGEYKGGTVSIVDSTGETVYETTVL